MQVRAFEIYISLIVHVTPPNTGGCREQLQTCLYCNSVVLIPIRMRKCYVTFVVCERYGMSELWFEE